VDDTGLRRRKRYTAGDNERSLKLQCYVSADERDRIEAGARAAGFSSVSTFLRVLALTSIERGSATQ